MPAKTATSHLSALRDFAVAYNKPDLLWLITKSQSIVEDMMWDGSKEAMHTKITELFHNVMICVHLYVHVRTCIMKYY